MRLALLAVAGGMLAGLAVVYVMLSCVDDPIGF